MTWYSYDSEGRVVLELRQRAGSQGACSNSYINNPSTAYSYTPNGNLETIQYPYGRVVRHKFGSGGLTDRITSVSVDLWKAGTPFDVPLLSNIQWEPFGGLRSYEMRTGGSYTVPFAVDYWKGKLSSTDTNSASTSGIACATPSLTDTTDGSHRIRALMVTDATVGAARGNLLRQVYTWTGSQLTREQTCVGRLGQTTETSQSFGYDNTLRLTSSTNTNFPTITSPVNPGSSRSYGYDRRGNLTSYVADQCPQAFNYFTGTREEILDHMVPNGSAQCMSRTGGETYFWDQDGRAVKKIASWWWWNTDLNYNANSTNSGLDSVVKTVTVNRTGVASAVYSYRFDAFNRRRAKTYPFDSEEEFFHDTGRQLLTQRSGNVVGTATGWAVDDYVWLAGNPVAMIRGWFTQSFSRALDTQASCNRLGEPGACGIYHVATDYLGKPVLMLQASTGKISNVAIYDDFGQPNRIPLVAGTSLPATSTTIADVALPSGTLNQYRARVLYEYVDLPTGVEVKIGGTALVSGAQQGMVWSPWTTTSSPVQIRLGSTSCGSQCTRQGIQTSAIEFRRFETGATPMWTTLRMPGQQYDAETDLFENWNRYYEPQFGRYLSPEPLLQSPAYVRLMAQTGIGVPTYSYALNNPIRYGDSTGKNPAIIPVAVGVGVGEVLVATGVIAAGVYCIGTQCLGTLHWPWAPSQPTVSPSSPTEPRDKPAPGIGPMCGPLTKAENQRKCQDDYDLKMQVCQDAARSAPDTLWQLMLCKLCLGDDLQFCLEGTRNPIADLTCRERKFPL